jgi:putative toxin-antitoxin system antitoxin component (TIGR02293 family)
MLWQQYDTALKDGLSIAMASRRGVDAVIFFDIAEVSGYKREKIAQLFDTSLKTLIRYREEEKKLRPAESELALKIVGLFRKGVEIFGTMAEFKSWLDVPAFGLAQQTPFDLMQTSGGIDLIMDELYRIEYGAVA